MTYPNFKYAQQAAKPLWFNEHPDWLYASATSGNSPFNEWYGFQSRQAALEIIRDTFRSCRFFEEFVWVAGEVYRRDDLPEDSGRYYVPPHVKPAPVQEMVWAESRF